MAKPRHGQIQSLAGREGQVQQKGVDREREGDEGRAEGGALERGKPGLAFSFAVKPVCNGTRASERSNGDVQGCTVEGKGVHRVK